MIDTWWGKQLILVHATSCFRCSMWLLHEFVMFSQSVLKCFGMARPSGHAVSLNQFWQLTCLIILSTYLLTSWHLRTFMFYFIHSHILASSTSTIPQWRRGGLGHVYPCKKIRAQAILLFISIIQYYCLYLIKTLWFTQVGLSQVPWSPLPSSSSAPRARSCSSPRLASHKQCCLVASKYSCLLFH